MNDYGGEVCVCEVGPSNKSKTKRPPVCCMSCFFQWMLSAVIMLSATGVIAATEKRAAEEEIMHLQKQLQVLRQQMSQTRQQHERQIDVLQQRILALEKATHVNQQHKASPAVAALEYEQRRAQHSALHWSISGLLALGGSTAEGDELQQLQAGTHDPRRNGFTVQALALAVDAELDPQVNASASLVSHIEPDGENVVELEQAFIVVKNSSHNLSAMAGQYFLDFGEQNTRHPNDWDFVDVPFLISRLFGGDKLRSQGIQFSWLPTLPWRSTLVMGVSNPNGETATSFLYQPGEAVAGHVLQAREVQKPADLLYSLKWSHQVPFADPQRIGLGASALFGPNASGDTTDTQIYGLNFEWSRYQSRLRRQRLFSWHTELMFRRYEAGDQHDPMHEILKDYGVFSQAVWKPDSHWAVGLRAEFADGNKGNFSDASRDARKRFSINLTHPISKSVKWRIQVNHDQTDSLSANHADSVWLQVVFRAGAKEQHK